MVCQRPWGEKISAWWEVREAGRRSHKINDDDDDDDDDDNG